MSGVNGLVERKCLACNTSLAEESNYFNRYKVCKVCYGKSEFYLHGKTAPQRFCQKCGVPHETDAFDVGRKSCRHGLKKHNEMRKRNRRLKKENNYTRQSPQHTLVNSSFTRLVPPSIQSMPSFPRPYAGNSHVSPFKPYSESKQSLFPGHNQQQNDIQQMLGNFFSSYQPYDIGLHQRKQRPNSFVHGFQHYNPGLLYSRNLENTSPLTQSQKQCQYQQQFQQYPQCINNQYYMRDLDYSLMNQFQGSAASNHGQFLCFGDQHYSSGNIECVKGEVLGSGSTGGAYQSRNGCNNYFQSFQSLFQSNDSRSIADLFVQPDHNRTGVHDSCKECTQQQQVQQNSQGKHNFLGIRSEVPQMLTQVTERGQKNSLQQHQSQSLDKFIPLEDPGALCKQEVTKPLNFELQENIDLNKMDS
eukprot:TRINITY_DN23116_c0_g1_i2.p2 TRINITY_DN23116_c0_g1~~TRINITY_DN23116_c0_g1_i2.p2  ORF type:complete len:416 (-),score=-4.29 TRINITY_DN23116_c0_g1_i2:183-1430(-)